jgi:signal transduction histidine kinase
MALKQTVNESIAKQAAHDIKSPLSVLNILSSSHFDHMPEESRSLMAAAVQRINEIANDLLEMQSSASQSAMKKESRCILGQIQEVIKEKNLSHAEHVKINFVSHVIDSEELSCVLPKSEMQRMVSNLLNNAIEATNGRKGQIFVDVTEYLFFVEVSIEDNGGGIPAHLLAEFGQQGKTSKKQGSGLGVYHAKKVLHAVGGSLRFSTERNVGTKITMRIPR